MKKRLGLLLTVCVLAVPFAVEAQQIFSRCESEIPSSTPTSRFYDHGDGTVTDTLTGLMWVKCAAGLTGAACEEGTAAKPLWEGALFIADISTDAGYTDWRLPNVKELASIVEQRCVSPAINSTVFPGTPAGYFWSSSPWRVNRVWLCGFIEGNCGPWEITSEGGQGYEYHIRLVRTAQ